jgi:hypothetical protein
MTSELAGTHDQIVELLPAYLTGQLESLQTWQVRVHVRSCASCQRELQAWEAVRLAIRQDLSTVPFPSPQLLDAVWAKIDAPAPVAWRTRVQRSLGHLWLVLRSQVRLLPKSIWLVSALACLLGLALDLFQLWHQPGTRPLTLIAGRLQVLLLVVAGASGCAFLCGSRVDPGFEWTLATPTSMRLLMLCRVLLVLSYNLLLGIIISLAYTATSGPDFWATMQLWIGPLLFLSSLCLTASLFLGSVFGMLLAGAVEVVQNLGNGLAVHHHFSPLLALQISPTNPGLLLAALCLLLCACFFVPRQSTLTGAGF